MSIEDLKNRFKRFAIEVALLIQKLPKNTINNAYQINSLDVQAHQLRIIGLHAEGSQLQILSTN